MALVIDCLGLAYFELRESVVYSVRRKLDDWKDRGILPAKLGAQVTVRHAVILGPK